MCVRLCERGGNVFERIFAPLFIYLIRLFLTMNPAHGEISRAMRNRGIEISILPQVYSVLLQLLFLLPYYTLYSHYRMLNLFIVIFLLFLIQ